MLFMRNYCGLHIFIFYKSFRKNNNFSITPNKKTHANNVETRRASTALGAGCRVSTTLTCQHLHS